VELNGIPLLSDAANYATIRRALKESSPRPRTPAWERIEEEVGRCFLEEKELESIDGCLTIE
jgi:hypothetical protein